MSAPLDSSRRPAFVMRVCSQQMSNAVFPLLSSWGYKQTVWQRRPVSRQTQYGLNIFYWIFFKFKGLGTSSQTYCALSLPDTISIKYLSEVNLEYSLSILYKKRVRHFFQLFFCSEYLDMVHVSQILLARLRTINTQRAARSLQLPSVLFDDISKDWTILKDLKFKKEFHIHGWCPPPPPEVEWWRQAVRSQQQASGVSLWRDSLR